MELILSQAQEKTYRQWLSPVPENDLALCYSVNFHGVNINFWVSDAQIIEKMDRFFPEAWKKSNSTAGYNILWRAPEDFIGSSRGWGEVSSSECFIESSYVFQRDFCARVIDDRKIELICPYTIDDGFFNFIRYFIPRHILDQDKVLFHTSCAIDEDAKAYLFFGFSGAGKTTISKMCGETRILGDDMSVLSFEGDKVFVEPALVGQQIYQKRFFDHKFPVEKAFWIIKDDNFMIEPMTENRRGRILSSFSGLFWDQLGPLEIQKVFELTNRLEKNLSLYQLKFNLQSEVWNGIQQSE